MKERSLAYWILAFLIVYLITSLITISPCEGIEDLLVLSGGASLLKVPVKLYSNADKDKESVYEDNRNKSGVYR